MTIQKIDALLEDLLAGYDKLSLKRKPKIEWKINSKSLFGEEFYLDCVGGVLQIEAASKLALIFAIKQAEVALLSGHLGEFLGKFCPRFPIRAIFLPSGIEDEEVCCRLLSLGFNAVITDSLKIRCFQEFGLKVFLLSCDRNSLDCVEGVYWRSSAANLEFYQHSKSKEMTTADLVLEEIKGLESILGKKTLIYSIPASDLKMAKQQAAWLDSICDEVGSQTVIAFPSRCGNSHYDHLSPHPFWNTLRSAKILSSTKLMPIYNIGAICQGEGLWPSHSFDLLEERFDRGCFNGAIGLCNTIPKNKGFLHLNLWVASMWMWQRKDPKCLAKTWFLAYKPELDFDSHAFFLDKVRNLVKELSFLRFENLSHQQMQLTANAIQKQLKQLRDVFETYDKKTEKVSFLDYYDCFEKDVENILDYLSQGNQFSEGCVSFWSNSKEIFDRPQRGRPKTIMEKVFDENN